MKKVFDMKTLNASQERVVLLPVDNDILSVAGPGSGKTRTVTYRLAYLAMACGILPSRLRAVTFTRAATQEMQERLCSLDTSLEAVHISTIHRLCRDIIKETQGAVLESRDFQSYIEGVDAFKEKKPEIAVVEALVKFLERDSGVRDRTQRIYYKIAEELELESFSSPTEVAKALLAPNDKGDPKEILQSYITYRKTQMHCRAHIPDAKLPTFSLKYAAYVQRLPKCVRRIELYEGVYEHYREILTEWKLLDYTDQIILAHLGLLFCTEGTRLALQSHWDILAVDEFQDVDAVQFEVFRLLCKGDTQLNVVGDPDQAIYGFRGGDASFISNFKKWFPNAEIVRLDTNYRSYAEIIDVAYSAVESIEQPYRAKGESAKGVGGSVGFAYREKMIGDFSAKGSVGVLAWTNKALNYISKRLLWDGIACSVNTRWGSRLNVSKPAYRLIYQTLQALDMVTGEIPFNRDTFLKYAQDMKGIGAAAMKVEGSTLTELRRSLKVAGYIRFLGMLKRLKKPDKVRAIANSNDFPSAKPEEGEVLATFDFSETYEKVLHKVNIKLYTIHRVKGLEFDTVFVDTADFSKPFAKDNLDESKRLLFVALSRAKQNLFLLGGEDQGNAITGPAVQMIKANQNTEPKPEPEIEPETDVSVNYRDEVCYLEDGVDLNPINSQRRKEIQKVSKQLQREFPGDWRLESDLSTVGPTPFILEKIRKSRSKPL